MLKKWPFLILSSKFLGLAQDCLRRSSYFEYESILFCSVKYIFVYVAIAIIQLQHTDVSGHQLDDVHKTLPTKIIRAMALVTERAV